MHYNMKRLHSVKDYVAQQDKLIGREKEIFSERDRKLSKERQRVHSHFLVNMHFVP